jgi:acetyltransferase-like isoleucine patch superfamily enzyme
MGRIVKKLKKVLFGARPLSDQARSDLFIARLRSAGVKVGSGCRFFSSATITVDLQRPELISIGDKVMVTKYCTILTHGFDWCVLRELYPGEIFGSAGHVIIGNNVFLGIGTIVLKGVTIGDNCVIGAGSVITRDIPSNSVAAGNPAAVIMTIQQLYEKYKKNEVSEALAYANAIRERRGREPVLSDFREFFYLFSTAGEAEQAGIDVINQTTPEHYPLFKKNHRPRYASLEEFIQANSNGQENK